MRDELFIRNRAYDELMEEYDATMNDIEDYGDNPVGEDEKEEVLADLISDLISDFSGFCHSGFEFDLDADNKEIRVYNIKWDFSDENDDYEPVEIHYTVNGEDIQRALQVLADNGIDEDECGVVLQAIGYALLDTELHCEDREVL